MQGKDSELLLEYSKLVNELVDARREYARINATLVERERFLSRVLALTPSVVYICDLAAKNFTFSSKSPLSILGVESANKSDPGTTFRDSILDEDKTLFDARYSMSPSWGDEDINNIDFRVRHADGSIRWIRSREAVFARDSSGKAIQVLGVLDDITSQKESEEMLRMESDIDPLSNLLNRRGFISRGKLALQQAANASIPCILGFFDIDGFKEINDTYGHAQGDIALNIFAHVLRKSFRNSDVLARLGGDEFVALAVDASGVSVEPLMRRMEANLRDDMKKATVPFTITFSAGWSFFSEDRKTELDELLATADSRMYQEKNSRKTSKSFP